MSVDVDEKWLRIGFLAGGPSIEPHAATSGEVKSPLVVDTFTDALTDRTGYRARRANHPGSLAAVIASPHQGSA